MEELLGLIIPLVFVAVLLAIGMFVGGWAERSHLRSLEEREQGNSDFLITQVKSFPGASSEGPPPAMLVGEAVIASDYLKSFLGKLRNIFGGEVRSYQTLMDRARREALQRIVEQARTGGYNAALQCAARKRRRGWKQRRLWQAEASGDGCHSGLGHRVSSPGVSRCSHGKARLRSVDRKRATLRGQLASD